MATEIEEKIELYQCNAIRITFFNNELSPVCPQTFCNHINVHEPFQGTICNIFDCLQFQNHKRYDEPSRRDSVGLVVVKISHSACLICYSFQYFGAMQT